MGKKDSPVEDQPKASQDKTASPIDDHQTTEEVVLSGQDRSTPWGAVGIADEPDGDQSKAADAASEPERPSSRIDTILRVLRKPELAIAKAFNSSGVKRVIQNRFSGLRQREESRTMGKTLEDAYGGTSSRRYRLQRFIRGNILVSLLLGIGLVYAGRLGVATVVDFGAHPKPVETAANKPKRGKAIKPRAGKPDNTTKPNVAKVGTAPIAPAKTIRETLSHCSVEPTMRSFLLSALGSKSSFAEPAYRDVWDELHRFHDRFESSELAAWYRSSVARRPVVSEAISAALPRAHALLEVQWGARRRAQTQLTELEQQLKELTDSAPLAGVGRINRGIKIRNQIIVLNERVDQGPALQDLDALNKQLALSKQVLAARDTTHSDQWNADVSSVSQAKSLDTAGLREYVQDLAQELTTVTVAGASGSPKLNRYRVQSAADDLSRLVSLLAFYNSAPPELVRHMDRYQRLTNERISDLLAGSDAGTALTSAVDYRQCLASAAGFSATR